jgi:sirohydrochlorin ferrochelatase
MLISLFLVATSVAAAPAEKVGVLVLAHGGSDTWNQWVVDATKGIAQKYPVEIAFGMALPRTIQEGINKLEAKGVNKIVVVPLFISSHSFIIRQTEYLLKKRDVLAEPAVVMDHAPGAQHGAPAAGNGHGAAGGHGGGHGDHGGGEPVLEQLNFKSEIVMTRALDDNPVVADILYDRIKELSTNPARETVIIVGHGPNPEEDNRNWVAAMESLAAQILEKQQKAGNPSRQIFSVTVRDDADKAIYEQAKENLRGIVRQAGKQGEVIVVPLLLSKGGVEQGIVKRLEGLTYKWSGRTLLPDPRFEQFITSSVNGAIK